MTKLIVPLITILAVLVLGVVIFGAIEYGRNSSRSPVSIIDMSQPADQISPKWIAITDPNQKTLSIVKIDVGENDATATTMSVTTYSKVGER